MTDRSVKSDDIVQQWHDSFKNLQAKQANGEKIDEDSVRSILVKTSEMLLDAGIVDEKSTTNPELSAIIRNIKNHPIDIPSGTDVSESASRMNALELASISPEQNNSVSQPPTTIAPPEPASNDIVQKEALQASQNILEKLAPPKELTSSDSQFDDALFGRLNQPMPATQEKPKSLSSALPENTPDNLMQMPVQIINPQPTVDLPKDALGRIIHQ